MDPSVEMPGWKRQPVELGRKLHSSWPAESQATVLHNARCLPRPQLTQNGYSSPQRTGLHCTWTHSPRMLTVPLPREAQGIVCIMEWGFDSPWGFCLGPFTVTNISHEPQAILSWERNIMHSMPVASEVHPSGNGTIEILAYLLRKPNSCSYFKCAHNI